MRRERGVELRLFLLTVCNVPKKCQNAFIAILIPDVLLFLLFGPLRDFATLRLLFLLMIFKDVGNRRYFYCVVRSSVPHRFEKRLLHCGFDDLLRPLEL